MQSVITKLYKIVVYVDLLIVFYVDRLLMVCLYHNLSVMPEHAQHTRIFFLEVRCWLLGCFSRDIRILGLRFVWKSFMDAIMSWLLALTFLFLGLFWICYQIHNPCTLVSTLDFTWKQHGGCRMGSRKCLPFRSTWFHPCFLWFMLFFTPIYVFMFSILSVLSGLASFV